MSPLNKKLLRDLRHMWGQALAISLVLAAGIATLVLATGAYRSLDETREAYYERYRFADVFATATRAPEYLNEQIVEIPGVSTAETRIMYSALLDIKGLPQPATGMVISLPKHGAPLLNGLYLRQGRLPDPLHDEEIVVNEAFAKAHGFGPGSTLKAILDGRKKTFRIVGIALSPEFIYALGPGDLVPNDKRFGIIWMGRAAAEAAFDLTGAFNFVSLKLRRDARKEEVLERLDTLLEPYGGRGAYDRKDQQSHAFLDAELTQLRAMSVIVPPIFLAVAAFLINMTLARLVEMEREQIGLLKALGYGAIAIGTHYLKFVSLIAGIGIALGFGAGIWLGRGMTRLYADFFHFPFLVFQKTPDIFIIAGGVGLAAGWVGALRAAQKAIALSPAVAMSPPVPTRYRRAFTERLGLFSALPQSSMMIVRHLMRYPVRAMFTVIGIASSGALLVVSLASNDSIEFMIDVTYFQSSRQDITVNFSDIRPMRIAQDLSRMPGVLRVETYRDIPVTLRNGNRKKRYSLKGVPPGTDMTKLLGLDLKPLAVPDAGIALSEKLAEILGVGIGDRIWVETMDKHRRHFQAPVTAILQGYLGLSAIMDLSRMNALLGDGNVVTAADLLVDGASEDRLYADLKETPAVSSIMLLRSSLDSFRNTLAQNINIMMTIYVLLAVIITFGVVYNSARIQLSERGRELASLRVLGFTRREVSMILLGETAILVALAIPLSWTVGYVFTWLLFTSMESELYRVPFVINRDTYGYTMIVIVVAATLSAFIVRRRIDTLDLIAVLKTRE